MTAEEKQGRRQKRHAGEGQGREEGERLDGEWLDVANTQGGHSSQREGFNPILII